MRWRIHHAPAGEEVSRHIGSACDEQTGLAWACIESSCRSGAVVLTDHDNVEQPRIVAAFACGRKLEGKL